MKPLSKLEVAERHIFTAVQMVALNQSPVTVHVVVKAAEEILLSLGKSTAKKLPWDFLSYIKPERQKDVRAKMQEVYNFFKHADRDPDAVIPGKQLERLPELNDMVLLSGIEHYRSLTKEIESYMSLYRILMMGLYPRLGGEMPKDAPRLLLESWKELQGITRSQALSMLRLWLRSQKLLTYDR